MKTIPSRLTQHGARIAVGVALLWAGLAKFLEAGGFAATVRQYGILPDAWLTAVAIFLPVFEVVLGMLLILGRMERCAIRMSVLLFALFFAILAQALARGLTIGCGCFGEDSASLPVALLRVLLLLVLSLYVERALRRQAPRARAEVRSGGRGGLAPETL